MLSQLRGRRMRGGICSGTLVKNVISDSPGGGVLMRCVCTYLSLYNMI